MLDSCVPGTISRNCRSHETVACRALRPKGMYSTSSTFLNYLLQETSWNAELRLLFNPSCGVALFVAFPQSVVRHVNIHICMDTEYFISAQPLHLFRWVVEQENTNTLNQDAAGTVYPSHLTTTTHQGNYWATTTKFSTALPLNP